MSEKFLTLLALDRSRRRWRFWAIIFVIIIGGLVTTRGDQQSDITSMPHIAGVRLDGFIGWDRTRDTALRELAADDQVQAVIVTINSPGGSMPAAIQVYELLRVIAEQKPVVAVLEEMAASAGYLAAIGADYVVANPATLTGSIGVFIPLVDATKLADNIGITSRTVASGAHKLATSPVDKVSEKSAVYLQNMVDELHQLFINYVSDRRQVIDMNAVTTGQAFTGFQAKNIGLIDALGGTHTAKTWLAEQEITVPIHWYDLGDETPWITKFIGQFITLPPSSRGAIAALPY